MEAVTAILGGEMRVGVVLQGKKVRDDNRTLQQAGISQSSNLDTLSFTLEPSSTHISPSMTTKMFPSLLLCDADQKLPRYDDSFSFSVDVVCNVYILSLCLKLPEILLIFSS